MLPETVVRPRKLVIEDEIIIIVNIVFNLKERVCEIGIKRALGATKDDICFEFMLEIIIVGVMSLLLGILLTYNINND